LFDYSAAVNAIDINTMGSLVLFYWPFAFSSVLSNLSLKWLALKDHSAAEALKKAIPPGKLGDSRATNRTTSAKAGLADQQQAWL
jgi:hypothetical protein